MVNPHRLTQEAIEAAEQGTADPKRLTQIVVEVPYQQSLWRLTQEAIEAAEQVTGADLFRRLTQIVVEVPITQPVHPWVEAPFPEYPLWSPAYMQDPLEGKEHAWASFFGIHQNIMDLGKRRQGVKLVRR